MENCKKDQKLAQKWACNQRTIRRWRNDGAPLDKPAAMRVWLASRKSIPPGTAQIVARLRSKTSLKDLTVADGELVKGAASALRRLETMEARTYRALERAMERGDAVEVKSARESWLRVSESLRRYDLAVESNRRAEELVPKKAAVQAAKGFAQGLRFAHKGFEGCVFSLSGLKSPEQIWQVLRAPTEEFLPAAVAWLRQTAKDVPVWLIDAIAEGAEVHPGEIEHGKALAEFLRAIVATRGAEARQLFDLRTAAEEKWRSTTDPAERSRIWFNELDPLLRGQMPAQAS